MRKEKNRAILVVSFGTSHTDTYRKTIEVLENEIHERYAGYPLYRAWTGERVRKKLEMRDGIHVFSVGEALEQMCRDGITDVAVQPVYMLNGMEYERMHQEIENLRARFAHIAVGRPLLNAREDCGQVLKLLTEGWKLAEDEVLVYMGHGTEHESNSVYAELNAQLSAGGYSRVFIGTAKARPTVGDILKYVKGTGARKVILAPFMIVAGDHAGNDMAGEKADSWKNVFEKEGYEVRCALKGLGEYEGIRKLFLSHLENAMEGEETC